MAPAIAPQPTVARISTRKAQGIARVANKRLNSREKRFCALKAQGWASRKAYQSATGCKSDATADVQAWRWNARPAIAAEIARLRAELTEEGALSRAEKRHHLARIARAEEATHRDQLTAVAIDNRMTGDDEPFRKAGGEDLRVEIFVVRIGEESGAKAPGLPADPVREAIDVTGMAATVETEASAPVQVVKSP